MRAEVFLEEVPTGLVIVPVSLVVDVTSKVPVEGQFRQAVVEQGGEGGAACPLAGPWPRDSVKQKSSCAAVRLFWSVRGKLARAKPSNAGTP